MIPGLTSDAVLEGLKPELPTYMAIADGVSTQVDKILWWKNRKNELPNWSRACKLVLLIQPSSAADESSLFCKIALLTAKRDLLKTMLKYLSSYNTIDNLFSTVFFFLYTWTVILSLVPGYYMTG